MRETFGERLKRLRIEKGYPGPKSLADSAKLTRAYVHRLETGQAPGENISVKTLRRLSRALGIRASVLLGTEKEKQDNE